MTVSISGGAVDQLTEGITHIQRADEVKDKRLAALHDYKAYENIQNAAANPTAGIGINVSLGSQKSESQSNSTTKIADASSVQANGDVSITAKDTDINIKGSNVSGDNVALNARENINITASTDENKTNQSSKSSGYGIGANITGGITTVNASVNKSKSDVKQNSTTYNESTVTADKDLNFTSGKDTNIKGGTLSGNKVTGSVGGNLNIETKQDSSNYSENSSSAGINTAFHPDSGITGNINKGSVDSSYKSASQQSGIYAGSEGFDIDVENNTDLKGAVIDSKAEADKNKLSTGTLSYRDLHNEAEYEASSKGVNINTGKGAKAKDAGITPDISMPAGDKAESDTRSAVAEGTIEIKDKEHQQQDIGNLSRDTENSLNKLGEIFDRETVEERQELAKMFGETAYKAVGDIAAKNNWDEGSPQKVALHALVGGIMSELGNSDFISGASGAMVNEMIQNRLAETFKDDPAMHQWASALIGGAVSEVINGNAQAGASAASTATKDNYILHGDQQYLLWNIEQYRRGEMSREEFIDKMLYYFALDSYYNAPIFNTDNISIDLKDGGEWYPRSQIENDSLMEVFINNGIDVRHGFSYAFQQYLAANNINIYDYIDTINAKKQQIIAQRGPYGNINTELIPKPLPDYIRDINALTNHSTVDNIYDNYFSSDNTEITIDPPKTPVALDKGTVDMGKSIVTNVTASHVDSITDSVNKLAKAEGMKGISDNLIDIGGKVLLGTNIYQDYQDYSGGNFVGAVVIDGIVYYIGGKVGSIVVGGLSTAVTVNPLIGWSAGAGIGIIGDEGSSILKDWLLTPDSKKK